MLQVQIGQACWTFTDANKTMHMSNLISHSCLPTLLQDLIAQGLLEPPKPKVKISNMMRVLGENAVMDPTAIESEVRQQMQERQQVSEGSAARRCPCQSSWCAWQPCSRCKGHDIAPWQTAVSLGQHVLFQVGIFACNFAVETRTTMSGN